MDDGQEQDHYEERLKEVFNSFDAGGHGSLNPEELSDLCQSLHLDDATPALLHALLQNQDRLTARVDFDQFKNALILVLSSTFESPEAAEETSEKPESPEVQPKFVKGSKRYGRRSTPEFIEPISDSCEVTDVNPDDEEDLEDTYESAVPRKRERWNGHETSTEEYEAEGQMHLWNPDEPSTPRGSSAPLSARLEERLREACEELAITWDGCAAHAELMVLCEQLGLELNGDVLNLTGDGVVNVQEFVSRLVNNNKPPTPSASTPYRQLKRHHSTQPFDEGGRRTSTLSSTIGMRLFSTLDDGTGYTPAEYILDAWIEEGIENSAEILQALNFDLDGKLSLSDLTMALENELLVTKNGIHQAALASFKAEIRYLLECVDREIREKEKIRSDLEKAEKQKTQFATEVDEHHSAIEHMNNLNLRKLEQDHREKLSAVRSELMREMDQIQQQAGLQREELEAEIAKIREDESFLRDHLSISVKENRRLEMELLDNAEKLSEAQSQIHKLQTSLENVMKEKFGDLDPGSADFFLQEERIKQLRSSYEAQCRELQDRIDELQSELRDFHALGRTHDSCHKALSEELESKSPGMESDPGIGSEDVQPFSMSLEVEMMLEQLKEQHLLEMEDLRNQLESKINEFDTIVEKQRASHEEQKAALTLQYQQEVQALREEMVGAQSHAQELQSQLEQAELERTCLEQEQAKEREELENQQEQEVGKLELEAHAADLEEKLKTLKAKQVEMDESFLKKMEELRNQHTVEMEKLKEEHEARLAEEREELLEQKAELERRLLEEWEREKKVLEESHEEQLKAKLEEVKSRFEEERDEILKGLNEQWQKERAQLDEQNNESLQLLLEEEMLRLVKEQEEKECSMRAQWENERAQLQEHHEKVVLDRILEERQHLQEQFDQKEKKLKDEWEMERLQLEEDYEGMIQDRLNEEREKFESERDEEEKRMERLMVEERERLEEIHLEAVKELRTKHAEERDALSAALDKLRDDIAQERKEVESSFSQRIQEVEDRFSGDQESAAERFQADVLKLEEHYQSELKALSESHVSQKLHWEAELQRALEVAEERRKMTEEAVRQEREGLSQEWEQERHELENVHREEVEALKMESKQLQDELEDAMSKAQRKEIELSMQLNELHSRLQEKHQLLAESESKAHENDLLLNQTVEDFKQERAELLSNISELEAKCNEMLSTCERQVAERIQLLTERDDLKMKVEELEMLLKQAAVDFEVERDELQQNLSLLEKKFKENQELDGEGLQAEIDELKLKIKELQMELCRLSEERNENEGMNESEEMLNTNKCTFPQDLLDEDAAVDPSEILCAVEADQDHDEDESATCDDQGDKDLMESAVNAEREVAASHDVLPGGTDVSGGGCDEGRVVPDHKLEDPSPEECELKSCDGNLNAKNKNEAVSSEMQRDFASSLEASDDCETEVVLQSCETEIKPQDPPDVSFGSCSHEDEHHETVVAASMLEDTGDPAEQQDAEGNRLPTSSHASQEMEHILDPDSAAEAKEENLNECAHDCADGDSECGNQECGLLELKALYNTATEENVLLHEKISLLQQKTEILENLLTHHGEKIKTGNQALEENYGLKVQMLLLMEHVKDLEAKAVQTADLQIRYEDCMCENAKLKEQNGELEKRVWNLEGRINVFHDFQDEHVSLVDEICRMRAENAKLFRLLSEVEKQDELSATRPDAETPTDDALLDLDVQLAEEERDGSDLEDCCQTFERQNTQLRRAITELQDRSQTLNEKTQAHRSEASRLAEENIVLKQKISALKDGDLKEAQEELTQTLEHLKKEKFAAQKAEDNYKKQISEMHLQSQQLEDENGMLMERNAQSAADMKSLQQQLAELMKEGQRREAFPPEEKTKMAACVSALEAELTKALEDTAQLEERNVQLSQQLSELREKAVMTESQLHQLLEEHRSTDQDTAVLRNQLAKAQEKVKVADESLQAVSRQSARLKTDLRVLQQERDSLKHEVSVLNKQLQNANNKNHILEMALHSSGLQNQSKKLYREEMSRLLEQEQQLLRQENERLQAEVRTVRSDLVQSRDKVHQLDATILTLNKHNRPSQPPLVKSTDQENASQKEHIGDPEAEQSCSELESLQQENEALKAQMARLSSQLLETFQAQLAGLLPPSPHRAPRHRAEDPDNMQDERERKMKNMEERLKEIELTLHNVKLLLKDKVAQLKDQLHKNGKADLLIKDLYVENTQLLKALEITKQRQKIAEKKNYLLEEKISSLNKIVRDLNPSSPPSVSYSYKSP